HRQCLPFPRLSSSFFFAATAPTDIYTLSLHDALPICPGALGWPRFRILSLGDDYRRRLIRRADLPSEVERELIGQLELSGPGVGATSRNPMFLGLLCQHMRKGNPFPENAHVVFEDYVETRLQR